MKQRKNKLVKWLAGVALCTALISTATGVALADTATPISEADYQIEMVGAEIRTDDHYGIRFKATTKAVREDSKYYVMIVPEAWLTDTAHDLQNAVDGDYYAHLIGKGLSDVDDPATEDVNERDFITMQTEPEKIDDNLYELKGTISNVHFTNSNTKFFGIAYEQMANDTRNYAERNDKSVRSICWVAGAALNDENFDGDKTNLKPTIDRAYDYITNGEETGATLDLSKVGFKQTTVYSLDKGSVTPLEMVGLPESLDLPIEYSVSQYDADVLPTITADGVLTVKGETGCSFVKAQIAGETKNLTVYNTPQMADGMLQDFAGHNGTRTYALNSQAIDSTTSSTRGNWQEVKEDAYGNIGYGVGSVTYGGVGGLRLNVNKYELEDMDFETITVRFLVESSDASVKNVSLAFFGKGAVDNPGYLYKGYPVNAWSYYTITKPTGDAWETFLDTYCTSGTGKSGNGGFSVYNGNNTLTIYIDYVSVGTIRMESHELENFNTSAAAYNHSGDLVFGANSKGTYYEIKADGASTTACGVVYAQMWHGNGAMVTRFGRTEAELLKVMENLETLTVRLLITRSGSTEYHFKVFGVQKLIPTNTWYDFTVTRDQILATISGDTEDAKIAQFASNFCSTGTANAPRMFACACNGVVVDVYLDSITYTATTAE